MPIVPVSYVDQPLVMKRVTPDYSRLAALYTQGGDTLANLALQRGQNTAQTLARLGALYSGFQEFQQQQKAQKAALALRLQEHNDEIAEKDKDRAERKSERDDAAKREQLTQDRGAARWMVDNAVPGPVDSALADFARRFPETAARFNRETTLPATVTPGALGEVSQTPDSFDVLNPSAQQVRQAALDAATERERQAVETRARRDDMRADRQLDATIANQKTMAGIAQQNANTNAAKSTNGGAANDVALAVQGMKEGSLPPQLPGRASKEYIAMMAEAKRQGYDLATAATDWLATQKHVATMNGSQQTRLNQSINALPDMLDKVDELAAKWKGGKFPILNRVNLAGAKNGVYGKEAASIATQLDSQIADVVADLGNVYMGGNSPTDHALELAGKSLKADWDEKVLHDLTTLARSNVTIRRNSIRNTGVQGASENNAYAPKVPEPAVERWERGPDGKPRKVGG